MHYYYYIFIIDTNELKSVIVVVEDNGEDCIGHHNKKDGERQDPRLWEIFLIALEQQFTADWLALIIKDNMTFIGDLGVPQIIFFTSV